MSTGICFEFKEKGSCKYGDECRYPHITSTGEQVSAGKGRGDAENIRGPQLGGADGNWRCDSCQNINFFHRATCNRCSNPRKDETGNWTCKDCGNLNFAHREKCNRCSAARPPDAPRPSAAAAAVNPQSRHHFPPLGPSPYALHQQQQQSTPDAAGAARQFVVCFANTYDPLESAIQYLSSMRSAGQAADSQTNYAGVKRSRFEHNAAGGHEVYAGYNAYATGAYSYPTNGTPAHYAPY